MPGWSLGRHMDVGLCLKALEMALGSGRRPMIFNTDQGSQYTSEDWQKAMQSEGIQISMDSKGRWADNIIMERFWRTYKHEFFLHRTPRNLEEAIVMTSQWLECYNKERPHSARAATPALQNRAKNGLTSGGTERYKKAARLPCTKEGDLNSPPKCRKKGASLKFR